MLIKCFSQSGRPSRENAINDVGLKLFFVLPPSCLSTRFPSHTSVLSHLPSLILFLQSHTLSLQWDHFPLPAVDTLLFNPSFQLERSQQESPLNSNVPSSRPTHSWPMRFFSQLTSSPCQHTGRPESAQYARSYGWWTVSKVEVVGSDSLNMMAHLCSCRTTLSFSHSQVKVGRLGQRRVLIHFRNFISSTLLKESHLRGMLGGGILMGRKMVSLHWVTPLFFVWFPPFCFVSIRFPSFHFTLFHLVSYRFVLFCSVPFCYKYPLLLGAFSPFSGFFIFYSAWVCPLPLSYFEPFIPYLFCLLFSVILPFGL